MNPGPATAFCTNCSQTVTVEWEDTGIGSYDYGGATGVDINIGAFCPECGKGFSEQELTRIDFDPFD